MKHLLLHGMLPAMALLLAGCAGAAFNRVELKTVRTVSVGQELMDLQQAHDKGIINDTEYAQAKQDTLKLLKEFAEMDLD